MSLGTASETGDDSLSAITFDSDLELKTKWKGLHRPPPTSPKSPYYSKPRKVASWNRSVRTSGSMPLSCRMSLTPQKLWLGTSKQGHVPGTAVYREKEDMYDEIIELKKLLHTQKSDVDLMRTKLRRMEEENNRKDRQIEQLLDPGRGPDFVRTLAEKRPDTGWVINGLRQRIFRLEQQCKEKDSAINKLQTDVKTTNLEEMRIAMETYYEEIHRLQALLASSEATGKKYAPVWPPLVEKKVGVRRQKKMSSALLNLSRSVQELTEENQSLKEDLDRVLSNSPTITRVKGYLDWSKPRLLRRIAELEKKLNSVASSKSYTSELVKSNPNGPAPKQLGRDGQEEQEHLQGTVKSLREERSKLQAQLLEKDKEVRQLLQAKAELEKELESAREAQKEHQEQEQALKQEIQTLISKCQELEESKKEEKVASSCSLEAHGARCTPPPGSIASQRDSNSKEEGSSWSPTSTDRRREAAARTLQAHWKARALAKKKAAMDEVAVVLQAAFRGHLTRAKLLASRAHGLEPPSRPGCPDQGSPTPFVLSPITQSKGSPEQEEAVTFIQSVLRAHLARARHSTTSRTTGTRSSRATTATAETSPPCLEASPGKEDSEASDGMAAEDKPGESAGLQLHSEPYPLGLQPTVALPVDDVYSDDSDDIVIMPALPTKKSPSPF
ncbi:IQ domain-containing protein E isoform X2 [Fukomys damarensis]|uniref:IQ domain-containing protein E isoform X2 n=1 Tax=Fukomys damarensis TaxID=885580 RepID=UPI00053F3A8D|nr:IQ domain-containing protein E isoform X2 [Fukomys damarensis]